MKKIISIILLLAISSNAFAGRTDCSLAKISKIQLEGQKVLYLQENAPWRTLGYLNNTDGTKERLSILLAAQMSEKSVVVGYPIDNYNCSEHNWGTSAYLVRIDS